MSLCPAASGQTSPTTPRLLGSPVPFRDLRTDKRLRERRARRRIALSCGLRGHRKAVIFIAYCSRRARHHSRQGALRLSATSGRATV